MWRSLRGRFLFTALILGLLVAAVAHQSERLVRASYQQSRTAIERFYDLHTVIEDLKKRAEEFAAVTRMAESGRGEQWEEVRRAWPGVQAAAILLATDSRLNEQPHFRGLNTSLEQLTSRLGDEIRAPRPRADELARGLVSLDRIVHLVERRVYDAIIDRTFSAMDTLDMLSKLIWGLGVTWVAASLGGFLAFEFVIRRPLLDVAEAMEMEGRLGTFDAPLPSPRSHETATLVNAFAAMRAQVQSRQVRLRSILDNTSDGIVTLDETGRITSLNPAAANLFGGVEGDALGMTLGELLGTVMDEWPPRRGDETIIETHRSGGALTLSLKFSPFAIQGATMYTVMVADVTERQALIGKLTVQAERDALTGLYNRRFFLDELARVWNRARRAGAPHVALIAIDLDHFKFINDTFGHQAGDRLLVEISRKLLKRGRQGDVMARLGGDEFAILLYDVDDSSAEQLAESYHLTIADHPFIHDGRAVEIGCSLGVALLDTSVSSEQDFMERADLSCRIAKSKGRNRHHLYRDTDRQGYATLAREGNMAGKVRRAMAEGDLDLAFQPIVRLGDGAVMWHEALLRMNGSDGVPLPAANFFADAERAGLATGLDFWTLRRVLTELTLTPTALPGTIINLSAQTVTAGTFATEVASALREYGVDPRRLGFEIDETTAVSNLAVTQELLTALRGLGCHTAISRFGSGYCSFMYLRELPVDMVKLDRDLCGQCPSDPASLALVRAMKDFAEALGRAAVAEWVETPGILAAIRAIGIEYGQGFLLGRPMMAAQHRGVTGGHTQVIIND